jgi:alkylation response protein AidB-like acyl-CoA dehydrogenase
VDDALWRALADAGWLSLPFVDGVDTTLLEIALVLEEVAKSAAVVPFLETMACAVVVAEMGGCREFDEVRHGVENGTITLAAAVQGTAAVRDGELSGVQRFVDYAQSSTHHLVAAEEEGERRLYVVDAATDAVTCQPSHHIGRTPQATVTYRDAAARPISAPAAFARLLDVATVLASVELVAYATVALALTVDHVRERVQFGRPIGSFQAVQHQCADMATVLEAARFLVYETVWKVGRRQATATELAVAKAAASRAGVFVTMQAHQLHGGIGVTEEYPLQFFSRRAQFRAVSWMSQHEALLEVAATVDEDEQWV